MDGTAVTGDAHVISCNQTFAVEDKVLIIVRVLTHVSQRRNDLEGGPRRVKSLHCTIQKRTSGIFII